ncbi:hypothetical protein G7Y89_g13979 [Cudoniella acicularis]|uniref:Uncharacterized protein n=1 Tax=Cudoniella acicularis TaxID=354080 RepID=A0A8H4VY57_9HELO|nr:hypothetical protein G7Y89_g13979 [Cudoniella acicularis]
MRFAASRRSSSESSTSSTMKESWPLIELQQTASLEEHLRNAMVRFLGNREPFEDGWFTFVNIAEQKVLEVSEALRGKSSFAPVYQLGNYVSQYNLD